MVGIDVIPAQPPRGASSIQGDFLSDEIRGVVREYVRDAGAGRVRHRGSLVQGQDVVESAGQATRAKGKEIGATEEEVEAMARGVLDSAVVRPAGVETEGRTHSSTTNEAGIERTPTRRQLDEEQGRVVDVVLSDMSEPWQPTGGMHVRSFSNPYRRMMNTSGMPFRDHAGSMVRQTAASDAISLTLVGHDRTSVSPL